MKRAGLNPMLALSQGPASTPGTTAATVQPVDALGRGISSASDVAGRALAMKQQQANIQLTLANAYKATQEGTTAAAVAENAPSKANYEMNEARQRVLQLQDQGKLTQEQTRQIIEMLPLLMETEKSRAKLNEQQTTSAKTQQRSEELRQPELEATAKWFETTLGENSKAAGFFKDILQLWNQIRGK